MLALLGRSAVRQIAAGIMIATVAANLMGDRNIPLALAFGVCNVGEALIFSWLLDRRLSGSYTFDSLSKALCFFAAAAISTMLMAVYATLAIKGLTDSSAQSWQIWKAWFTSDAMGIITIAPVVISLGEFSTRPWTRNEVLESLLIVFTLTLVAGVTYLMPPYLADWWLPVPVATIFPLLVWAAARCSAIVVSASLLLISMIIVGATTNGMGHFGDPSIPIVDRVLAAHLTMISIALCSILLIAVFAERRVAETAVRASEERLSRLAAAAPGIIYTFRRDTDGRESVPYASPAIGPIMGVTPDAVRNNPTAVLGSIDAQDARQVADAIAASSERLTPFKAEFRYQHPERGPLWMEAHSSPVREADGAVVWHGFVHDITARKSAETRIQSLMGEVDHRAKNLLAVVQAVALRTVNEAKPEQFTVTFTQRIRGLAASHDLLTMNAWQGVGLAELLTSQLGHFENLFGSRIVLSGPPVRINPVAAQSIGMALHELATNAGKYGALANDTGRIDITWSIDSEIIIDWKESGGPAATAPVRRGFGHRVMVEMLKYELDAKVALSFDTAGVQWRLVAPSKKVFETNPGPAMASRPSI